MNDKIIMFKDFNNRIKGKRYQELSKSYRIVLWLRYMPFGYVKGMAWYFIKRLRWETVCDPDDYDQGRINLGTCIDICIGITQADMKWYYNIDEILREDGIIISRKDENGFFDKILDFIKDKFVEIIDGKMIYD